MTKFSVTCFGTGDGWPCADRNHAAFLYQLGKTCILIDCGEAIDRNYKASGLSYDLFDAIFISHLHSDHFGGFFMLMQGCWLEGRTKPLPVYLPKGAIKPLRAMLNAGFLFDEALDFRLELRLGFLLEAGGRRVVHSADLGKPEDLSPALEKPIDLLMCELAHFSPQEIFTFLHGRKVKRVSFMHVGRPFYEDLARTGRLAAKMLPNIPHSFPRDLDQISF